MITATFYEHLHNSRVYPLGENLADFHLMSDVTKVSSCTRFGKMTNQCVTKNFGDYHVLHNRLEMIISAMRICLILENIITALGRI